jgi:hypothetical protein
MSVIEIDLHWKSIEFIGQRCFLNWNNNKFTSTVREVTCEAGSKLREIEDFAFAGCYLLDSICLPASVEVIHGAGFPEYASGEIASDHPSLRVNGDFVVDSRAMCLLQQNSSCPFRQRQLGSTLVSDQSGPSPGRRISADQSRIIDRQTAESHFSEFQFPHKAG